MASKPRRSPASTETANVIEMMLASNDSGQVKAGLQRACEILEGGQAFLDNTFLNVCLPTCLTSPQPRIRRWAYKLVALLKDGKYINQLEDALLTFETDPENRGWASAAYASLADELRKTKLIAKLSDYQGTSLELAAKLYARGEPAKDEFDLQTWELEALARKWLCLLCGYARHQQRTIDQRFGDLDLVRNSIKDDDLEVVEYSLWAEFRHPDGSFRHILRPPDQLLAFPNVRRWLYRLLTKDAHAARSNLDLLTERMDASQEPSEVAREGLALGLAQLKFDERRTETIDWFLTDPSPKVRLALIDHLALTANKYEDNIARSVLTGEYNRPDQLDLIRAKILSVAKPDWKLNLARLARPGSQIIIPQQDLFAPSSNQIIVSGNMEVNMGTNIKQSGHGNSMAGVAGGNIVSSTINTLQHQADPKFNELTPLIKTFIDALAASHVSDAEKEPVLNAIEEVAKATGDAKKSKLQALRVMVRGMLSLPDMAATAIEGGNHLVRAIESAISG